MAKRLKIHRSTVIAYLNQGLLKGISLPGRKAGYRIKESDLEDFLTKGRPLESSRPLFKPSFESGTESYLSPADREFFERIINLPPENRRLLEGMTNMLLDSDIPEEAKAAFTEGINAHLRTMQVMKGNKPPPSSS